MLARPVRIAFLSAIAGFVPSAAAAIVYDHYTFFSPSGVTFCNEFQTNPPETASDMEVPGGQENLAQIAQRLTLVGTDRFVTRLDMSLWAFAASIPGSGPCVTDVTAYLYAPSGSAPGALLWSGTVPAVSLNPSNTAFQNVVPVAFVPDVTVPDTVYLAFSHSNIVNQRGYMGVTFNQSFGGGIGLAGAWFDQDSTTGAWAAEFGGGGGSLVARLTAVPAPGSGIVLTLGLVALRRRR